MKVVSYELLDITTGNILIFLNRTDPGNGPELENY